jgi:hypothetical protein
MSIQASQGILGHKNQNAVRDRKIKTTFLSMTLLQVLGYQPQELSD